MKRLSSILIALPLALAVACGTSAPKTQGTSSPTPSPTPSGPVARLIVSTSYTEPPDLSLYDVAANSVRALTSDGTKTRERHPRFRTGGGISYVADGGTGGDSLMQISTEAGAKPSVVFRAKDRAITAYAWSPDHATVAYLTRSTRSNGGVTVTTYNSADGSTKVIRRLPDVVGRGINEDDSFTVAWSPNGEMILVVHTALATDKGDAPSMYVLRADGADAVSPLAGTHAVWSADGTSVIYRSFGDDAGWFRLTLKDGTKTALPISKFAVRPSLSIDGTLLAYDVRTPDSPEGVPLAVAIFDLNAGTERRLAAGFSRPVWLHASALAASKIKACSGELCGEIDWEIAGPAEQIAVANGTTQELKLANTIDSGVYYA